ncbi:hypothetical protein AB1Y20_004995 [Prymnesium parvum]|uniref:Protein kinase domain-containing protein n=1 Tax=Prymnesium parvum TaxID=97485 RepID=A0AB34J2Y3_PRYPA
MSAHTKMLQLVAPLLHRHDVAPGGDGLALSLSLFSKVCFHTLLRQRRAHEAFLYLLPFLRRERESLRCDAEQESCAFWTLHDALLERALADNQTNAAALRGCSLRAVGVAWSPTAPGRTDDELVALLNDLHTLRPAMENWERAAADAGEDLTQFVANALRSQQRISELEDEVKTLRARVRDAEKAARKQNSFAVIDPRSRMMAQKLHQDAHGRESSADRQSGERPSLKRPSSPQDKRPSKRATPNGPPAPGAPPRAGGLGIRRTLLHAGCSTREPKHNVRIYRDPSLEVHRMVQYVSQSKEGDHFEVLLVLQRSGRMLCFKRPWAHASTVSPSTPVEPANQAPSTTSAVHRGGRRMGVHLATQHFRKLEALVEAANEREMHTRWREIPQGWLRPSDTTFTFKSENVHVRVGALKRPFKQDKDAALRHTLHIFKHLQGLEGVVHPIGMMTGMRADPVKTTEGAGECEHLLFRNVEVDGFQRGLPPFEHSKPYIDKLEGAIQSIHARGIIHSNLDPFKCFWKTGDHAGDVSVKIVDWDNAWFTCCKMPNEFIVTRADDPRVKACLDNDDPPERMDACVIDALRTHGRSEEHWSRLMDRAKLFDVADAPEDGAVSNLSTKFADVAVAEADPPSPTAP